MSLETIPLSWVVRQAKGATSNGLHLDHLFERAMIAPRFGDDRDHITPMQLNLFYAALVLNTDDGAHGMARRRLPPQLGPLGLRVLFGSSRLGDGLDALSKFYRACFPSLRLNLSTSGPSAFLAIQFDDEREEATLQEDVQLSYLYFGLTCFLGRPFPISWVATRDPAHVSLGRAHWAMKCRVKLQNCAGLSFPREMLSARPALPENFDVIWGPLERGMSLMEGPALSAPEGVNNRQLHIDRFAGDLGVAPSTYRNLLGQNGASFRKLREQALIEAAVELLRSPISLEAIAAELGYSDARSFRRFVKTATGRTPSELRDQLGRAVSPARLKARMREVMGLMPL